MLLADLLCPGAVFSLIMPPDLIMRFSFGAPLSVSHASLFHEEVGQRQAQAKTRYCSLRPRARTIQIRSAVERGDLLMESLNSLNVGEIFSCFWAGLSCIHESRMSSEVSFWRDRCSQRSCADLLPNRDEGS